MSEDKNQEESRHNNGNGNNAAETRPVRQAFNLWQEEKQCILAVDDIPENIEIIRNLLGGDYQIKAATKGSKAIDIARKHPQPDLILLDVMMPEMSGYEVCRTLKNDADTLHIPIIFISGKNDAANESEVFELGAADYITKPFHPGVIQTRVKSQLQLLRQQKKIDRLLENVLPKRIIQEFKSRGFSQPELFSPVTLMSLELIENCCDEDALAKGCIDELTNMFTVLDGIVARHGAERIKTSSGIYLAACGIPIPNIDHARIMIQIAIDFINFFKFSNHSLKFGWSTRIGIHSGNVIGSIIGRKHYHYDLFGEAVRIATQTKDTAPSTSILVTEATMQLAKNSFSFNSFRQLQCGNDQAIDLFSLSSDNFQGFRE